LRLQLQNNSILGVEVYPEAYSCTLCFKILKNLVNFGDEILISKLITTVESNLRTSKSWNIISIMNWAFTKPSTVRPPYLTTPIVGLHSIQLSSSRQSNILTRASFCNFCNFFLQLPTAS